MHLVSFFLFILMVLLGTSSANASLTEKQQQSIQHAVDKIIAQTDPHVNVGIDIRSLKTGEVLYQKRNHRLFVPASTMKLLTAQAALAYLGRDFQFSTLILTNAKHISHGVVHGSLFVVYGGDPTLSLHEIYDLVTQLKAQGVRRVTGNVYLDNTAYDDVNLGPGWMWDDEKFCYSAPINAMIVNHNCIPFQLMPGSKLGKRAKLMINPKYHFAALHNHVVTKNSKVCRLTLNIKNSNDIDLGGCIRPNNPYHVNIAIADVSSYHQYILRDYFRQAGIHVQGKFTSGVASPDMRILASHASEPLYKIITTMLKNSDDIIASSLLKKLGQQYYDQQGSWKNGSQAIVDILAVDAALDPSQIIMSDGSGLSRYNMISPAQLVQLLAYVYHNFGDSYEFIAALPIAGYDGTLSKRLKHKAIIGRVRAKTGTMQGVTSLAGYMMTKSQEPLVFSIIVNGFSGSVKSYQKMEDKILEYFVNYDPSSGLSA